MGLRQRRWADRVYAWLLEQLGNRCVHCGETDVAKLQLDHIIPRDWDQRLERSWRVSILRREFRQGKLQILCGPCNLAKRIADREIALAERTVEDIWKP